MKECEVLIVGSGPAGLSAARSLYEAGIRDVTVIERMSGDSYRHYHRTCGEAVSARTILECRIPDNCIIRRVSTLRVTYRDTRIDIPVRGAVIDRNALLSQMRSVCGAEFVRDSVRSVRKVSGGYAVSGKDSEYLCRYLIGADGAFSAVRRDIFGTVPPIREPAVNNIVKGDGGDVLGFTVSSSYPGAYRWDFPSSDGTMSAGYILGTDDIADPEDRGIRFITAGKAPSVADGNCCIIGDAASLANPICFGGIAAAMLSGEMAAKAIAAGDLSEYSEWVRRDRMFDPHFLEAEKMFGRWSEEDYADAVVPFRNGYSLLRGAWAMMRRPKWAKIYFSVWMALRYGW